MSWQVPLIKTAIFTKRSDYFKIYSYVINRIRTVLRFGTSFFNYAAFLLYRRRKSRIARLTFTKSNPAKTLQLQIKRRLSKRHRCRFPFLQVNPIVIFWINPDSALPAPVVASASVASVASVLRDFGSDPCYWLGQPQVTAVTPLKPCDVKSWHGVNTIR